MKRCLWVGIKLEIAATEYEWVYALRGGYVTAEIGFRMKDSLERSYTFAASTEALQNHWTLTKYLHLSKVKLSP
jgi:hypothetical protein